MKRLLHLLVILLMAVCLAACGQDTGDVSQPDDQEDLAAAEEETVDEDLFLGDYALEYFQSGPLIIGFDTRVYGSSYGAFDSSGKVVIPCKYYSLQYIGKDRYLVCDGEDNVNCTYGIVDLEGNEIVPCEYTSIEPANKDDLTYFFDEGTYYFLEGYKEPAGEFVIARKEGSNAEFISIIDGRSVQDPEDGMMLTFDNGLMEDDYNSDADNIKVPEEISNKYKDAPAVWGIPYGTNACLDYKSVRCHYYVVSLDDNEQIIVDANGRELGNGAKWAEVGFEYANGLIAVRKDAHGPWALIDSEGNEVTDYNFDVFLDCA